MIPLLLSAVHSGGAVEQADVRRRSGGVKDAGAVVEAAASVVDGREYPPF